MVTDECIWLQVFADAACRRELNQLSVHCCYGSCDWTGLLKDYEVNCASAGYFVDLFVSLPYSMVYNAVEQSVGLSVCLFHLQMAPVNLVELPLAPGEYCFTTSYIVHLFYLQCFLSLSV